MSDNEVTVLNEIKKQIERFDSKANILSAICGVLLGISFSWIVILKSGNYSETEITTYFLYAFIFLYILFLCSALVTFIWSILPRNKPKEINKVKTSNSILYYKDLQKMKVDNIEKEILQNQNSLSEQIKINSMIAAKKHKLLVWGTLFLAISIFSIVISVSLYMFI